MSGDVADSASTPGKLDPETLELRGRPPRVVRFRKKIIIGLVALGSAALIGIAWMALGPAEPGSSVRPRYESEVRAVAPPEALADAPRSYDDMPELGPPLPGDLGRAIVAQQRGEALEAQGVDSRERERERRAAELKSARESALMVPLSGAAGIPSGGRGQGANEEGGVRHEPERAPQGSAAEGASRHRLMATPSRWTLSAGSVIAAALLTGINSDLPGLVTAQVTRNVHDSVTGRTLLIPQGSRLIGTYESDIAFGQERALVVWERLILPDGASIGLDNLPASDVSGHAGLEDEVDRHGGRLLKGIALSTLLGVGTELSLGGEGELLRAVREATQSGASRAGDRIVSRHLDVEPTLTIRPGWPLRVVVHKDIVLEPWRG